MLSFQKLTSNQFNLIDVSMTFDKEEFISNVYINFELSIWMNLIEKCENEF